MSYFKQFERCFNHEKNHEIGAKRVTIVNVHVLCLFVTVRNSKDLFQNHPSETYKLILNIITLN